MAATSRTDQVPKAGSEPECPASSHDVFISYSSRDRNWVRGNLLKGIEEAGLRAFIDYRDFARGAPSIREMEHGIRECRKTILVLTPSFIDSEWCEVEALMLATLGPANRSGRLVPLLREPCAKPLWVEALTHIDFTDGADTELAWFQLLSALRVPAGEVAPPTIPVEVQAKLDEAKTLTESDRFAEAIPILEEALGMADRASHAIAGVKVRLRLGAALYQAQEDSEGAERHFRAALPMVPVGSLDLKHSVLHGLGEMLLVSGRLGEARAALEAALRLAEQMGKPDEVAASLLSLSLLERDLGFPDRAVEQLDEAAKLLLGQALSLAGEGKRRNAHLLGSCFANRALLCRDAGETDEALAFFAKAEEQHRVSGAVLDAGKALLFRGEAYCASADWAKGCDCFAQALKAFRQAVNPLWEARALEHVARVHASHEQWDEAMEAAAAAVDRAEMSGHPGEVVHFLCMEAEVLREWKRDRARHQVALAIHSQAHAVTAEEQSKAMASVSSRMGEIHASIDQAIRSDEEVRDLLERAKAIARGVGLNEHLANCILSEAHATLSPDDSETRRGLIEEAIVLLKEELQEEESPKRRGHLMGRISGLCMDIGEKLDARAWLDKARRVFETCGDALGLANCYGSLAELHISQGELDDGIRAYRKVLSTIEGRCFYHLSAGARISLAAALRSRGELAEASRLLDEAESLSESHHFTGYTSVIARNREQIENEAGARQGPTHSLAQLLNSLDELLVYRPEYAPAYLGFWYFSWKAELLAVIRSGPGLSLMVIGDDVERFVRLCGRLRGLADNFLMTTTREPRVEVEPDVLPIPPTWLFPASFPFLCVNANTPRSGRRGGAAEESASEDRLPIVHLEGPARMIPPFVMIDDNAGAEGEGRMMMLSTGCLPQAAIDLMIGHPREELARLGAIWFPVDLSSSKDAFLTELRVAHEQGVFPVYLDKLPTSSAVAVGSAVRLLIPEALRTGECRALLSQWSRAMRELANLRGDEAQAALLALPELAEQQDCDGRVLVEIEIRLAQFVSLGEPLWHPILLVRA